MRDSYLRFSHVYPLKIKSWQTDNGQENLGEFDEMLAKDGIPHLFIYLRSCKTNSLIERHNRTIQEEFIYHHIDMIWDRPRFAKELAEYLIFYNTKRPRKLLGLKSPLNHIWSAPHSRISDTISDTPPIPPSFPALLGHVKF